MAVEALVEQFHKYSSSRVLAFLIFLVTVLLLILTIINTILDWLPAAIPVIPLQLPQQKTQAVVTDLPNYHLLGDSEIGGMQETNLRLTLEGVLTDQVRGLASAIISKPGAAAKVYFPGQSVMEGVELYAVEPQAVVLRVKGQLQLLPLVRPVLQFAPPGKSIWQEERE